MSHEIPGNEALQRENRELAERLEAAQVQIEGLVVAQRMAHVGHWIYDVASGGLSWSDEIYRLFGLAPQAIAPNDETFYAHVHPDDRTLVWETSRRAINGEIDYDIEHRIVRSTGEVRIVREQAEIARDAAGKPLRMLGIVHDITEQRKAEEEQRQRADELHMFLALVDNTPDSVFVSDLSGALLYSNPALRTHFRLQGPDAVFETPIQLDDEMLRRLRMQGTQIAEQQYQRHDGSTFPGQATSVLIHDSDGEAFAVGTVIRDLSAQQAAEAERLSLQQQVIDAQQDALRELSTPLIPVAAEVVVMPLVGTIDGPRAQQIMEALLEGIIAHQAAYAILDITGVRVVDTHVAAALLRVAQAAKLLGTQVILTGIGADVAQSLVYLQADLGDIITLSNLQRGMAYALGQR